MSIELLAFIASTFGVAGSLPQIFKILRTGETRALSLTTSLMMFVSSLLWVLYGLTVGVYSIVFWNGVSTVLSACVAALKIRNEQDAILAHIAQALSAGLAFGGSRKNHLPS